ncbi:MAG: CC/Se motif family (seleno)protein [Tepidanaerobacteraceae bacterium]|nr:CC/Se motif family (seleno)protein [Tepidanaerobacteraceae bacterium]
MPAVYVGTPQDTSEYDVEEVSDIKVYTSPFVDKGNGLRVTTSGFAFFKGLVVSPIS